MSKAIYLDNAATTKLSNTAFEKMQPYFLEEFGNPSSIYQMGNRASSAILKARETIAEGFNADFREIYFTSGGTEADNWALKGIAEKFKDKGRHIITSEVEHHAILHTCEHLEELGFEVTYLKPDSYGQISRESVEEALRDDTILVSIIYANNEIGTINPIKEIGELLDETGIIFHTDAVQMVPDAKIDVKDLKVDLMSFSSHKLHGPKGVGGLYIRLGLRMPNLMDGGAQEYNRRGGTENVPGIVGFAQAFKESQETMEERTAKQLKLRDHMIERVLKEIPESRLNGHPEERLSNNAHFCFRYIEGESMLLMLDMMGIQASSGSACTSGSLDPSHVLLSIGLPHGVAHGSVRFSLSDEITKEDIDYTVDKLKDIVERLRQMSPLTHE